ERRRQSLVKPLWPVGAQPFGELQRFVVISRERNEARVSLHGPCRAASGVGYRGTPAGPERGLPRPAPRRPNALPSLGTSPCSWSSASAPCAVSASRGPLPLLRATRRGRSNRRSRRLRSESRTRPAPPPRSARLPPPAHGRRRPCRRLAFGWRAL